MASLHDAMSDTIDIRNFVEAPHSHTTHSEAKAVRLSIRHFAAKTTAKIYEFTKPCIQLGRSEESDVTLTTPIQLVSRRHAEIYWHEGHYWLRDVGSRRGTLCNTCPVIPNKPLVLSDGDIIQMGDFLVAFQHLAL